jgi:hypothetical protein
MKGHLTPPLRRALKVPTTGGNPTPVGLLAISDLFRQRTSLDIDGPRLPKRRCHSRDPYLILSELRNRVRQELIGISNVKAHTLLRDLDDQGAASTSSSPASWPVALRGHVDR